MCYKVYLKHKESETTTKPDFIRRVNKTDLNQTATRFEDLTYGYESTSKERLDSIDSKSSLNSFSVLDRNGPNSTERSLGYNDGLTTANPSKMEYIEKLIPILEEIVGKIKDKRTIPTNSNQSRLLYILRRAMQNYPLGPPDMNVLYEDLPESHFVYNSNIMAVIQLKPLSFSQLAESADFLEALQPDKIIEQVSSLYTFLYFRYCC